MERNLAEPERSKGKGVRIDVSGELEEAPSWGWFPNLSDFNNTWDSQTYKLHP
jgi:hypothetical protein